jgi:thiosulfate dehydrogenase
MKVSPFSWAGIGVAGIGAVIGAALAMLARPTTAPLPMPLPEPAVAEAALPFMPPLAADAPEGPWGDAVRLGERIILETGTAAADHVGNGLACRNCHLDAGSKAGAAPLWAAFPNFPAYRTKNNAINSFQKRAQDCFLFSMNGKPPALGSDTLNAIEAYAAYMARGLPLGESPAGRGFPAIAAPALPFDETRGAAVYAENCTVCHGEDGAGQVLGDIVYPPLWGARSYNWGAGMGRIDKAAAFIRANMPQGIENSLSVQQAWDVAAYIDSQHRPQDPRFNGDVAATRKAHHDTEFSRYGLEIDGRQLGSPAASPPSGASIGR